MQCEFHARALVLIFAILLDEVASAHDANAYLALQGMLQQRVLFWAQCKALIVSKRTLFSQANLLYRLW